MVNSEFFSLHFMMHWEHDEYYGVVVRIDKFNFHLKTHLKLLVAMRYLSYVCYIFYVSAVNTSIDMGYGLQIPSLYYVLYRIRVSAGFKYEQTKRAHTLE